MKKMVRMTEERYNKLLAAEARPDPTQVVGRYEEAFARQVITLFGLTEAYPDTRDYYLSHYHDEGARKFLNDVRNASNHAAAKDAMKRIRDAVKEAF